MTEEIRLVGKEYLIWYGYVGKRLVKYLDGEWYFTDNEELVENGEVIDDALRFLDDTPKDMGVHSTNRETLCKCSQCGELFFRGGVHFDTPLLCDACNPDCKGGYGG